ncbi:DUF1353 domain-containing protein [Helicobacter cetorum]|uniref:DUF1353 domain-containing protein n=1 Tax=Helicobacter cetorum TaxID=138563 RepID=UPI000CF0DE36|nr:DUF1353 domain-containing protein [Helicobacter cetorum]
MQNFTEPIKVEFSNDGKSLRLLEGFRYYLKSDNSKAIIVPTNFKTDGFTNMGLSFIVPKYGKGLKCAILHDYMCDVLNNKLERPKDFMISSRKACDKLFLESMLETKAFMKFKAYLIYFGVRVFARIKGLK